MDNELLLLILLLLLLLLFDEYNDGKLMNGKYKIDDGDFFNIFWYY